jgi:uncharacterized phage protein (TIGR02216 family)
MTAIDWAGLMRAGFRRLRLTPEKFWQLTPAELALMLGHEPGSTSLTRDKLAALARSYPDRTEET